MSLKAGRVGVAPDQVDEFGVIKSEVLSGYTKQEADAKFETKAAATEALAGKVDKSKSDGEFASVVGTLQDSSYVRKQGSVVDVTFNVNGVTAEANTSLGVISDDYRPYKNNIPVSIISSLNDTFYRGYITTSGGIFCTHSLTNDNIRIHTAYIL